MINKPNNRIPRRSGLRTHPARGVVRVATGLLILANTALASPRDATTDSRRPNVVIVEGQVTNRLGSGLAGVVIEVYAADSHGVERKLITRGKTDKLGDFRLKDKAPPDGDIIVTLSKPLYATIERTIRFSEDELPPYLAETLNGNLILAGRVLADEGEAPIAEADVTYSSLANDWHTASDEEGRFTFRGIPPGKGLLVVQAQGFGRQPQTVNDLEDFGEIIVTLKPQRRVEFKVTDDQGKPIEGVNVECYDQPHDDRRFGETDAQGRISFDGLNADAAKLLILLSHEDHVSSPGFDRDVVLPKERLFSTHDLTMPQAGRIEGMVREAMSNEPLHGARIMTGAEYTDLSPRDWSTYQGKYTIVGVPTGMTTVTVHYAGYAPELSNIEVKPGETTSLDFTLKHGAAIEGWVKDEANEPIAGVQVDATKWRERSTLALRAMTDQEGHFIMEDAPHDEFEVIVRARGYEMKKGTLVAGMDTPPTFRLTDAAEPARGAGKLGIGEQAPSVKLTSLKGKTFDIGEMKGKTILLDFWATWCGPCVQELPNLAKAYEKFSSRKDFVMIGVSLDDDLATLRSFLKKRKIKWPQVNDDGGANEAARRYGVEGLPSMFIIGPDGRIIAKDLHGKALLKQLERILADLDPT